MEGTHAVNAVEELIVFSEAKLVLGANVDHVQHHTFEFAKELPFCFLVYYLSGLRDALASGTFGWKGFYSDGVEPDQTVRIDVNGVWPQTDVVGLDFWVELGLLFKNR